MEPSYGIFPSEPAAVHFTARVSGSDMPLGFFSNAAEAQQFAEQFIGRGNADGYNVGTLEFVFLTAGAF